MNGIKVGIVGCGFIGGALKRWIEEHNSSITVLVSDPYKGMNDDLSSCDVIFVSIHIPTEADGTQDLTTLESIIENLPQKPIFIRTTIIPGTSKRLAEKFGKEVYFMPEFLTERTAYEDFSRQPMVFTAHSDLLQKIFVGKRFIEMSSEEAEITKYAHNVFGALKVTYFNGIYDICKKNNLDYDKVREGVLLSGYINAPHTQVPGPDGKFGYGGKCFPKDVNAFTELLSGYPIYEILKPLKSLNSIFRGEDK